MLPIITRIDSELSVICAVGVCGQGNGVAHQTACEHGQTDGNTIYDGGGDMYATQPHNQLRAEFVQ